MNDFDDLPDELDPRHARNRTMRTVGIWMATIGCLLAVVGGVGFTVSSGEFVHLVPGSGALESDHYLSTGVVGAVLFVKGGLALAVAVVT